MWCSMLQHVTVCYCALHCFNVCTRVVQCAATCCSVMQCVALRVADWAAGCCSLCRSMLQGVAVCCLHNSPCALANPPPHLSSSSSSSEKEEDAGLLLLLCSIEFAQHLDNFLLAFGVRKGSKACLLYVCTKPSMAFTAARPIVSSFLAKSPI